MVTDAHCRHCYCRRGRHFSHRWICARLRQGSHVHRVAVDRDLGRVQFRVACATLSENFLSSSGMQVWFGRILVFVVVLSLGGLLGWGIAKLVRLSVLSGMDRTLGTVFGFARGVVLVAVFIIGGQYASFDQDNWWRDSRFIPQIAVVSDWLRVMAPKGMEMLQPGAVPDDFAAARGVMPLLPNS
ncbi:MAG: CvpA family protein [Woeseiaceae bacterium]|nr:CvpA family protein [Woeseiaceae bacterium]